MKTSLKVSNNIIIICTTLIVFHKSTSNNLPIFSFKKFFYFLFIIFIKWCIPFFKETHFTVKERTMAFLTAFSKLFSVLFTVCQDLSCSLKYLLNWMKPITSEIRLNVSLIWFWVIITLKIKNPISIKMRMNRHVKCITILPTFICWTWIIVSVVGSIAFIYAICLNVPYNWQ